MLILKWKECKQENHGIRKLIVIKFNNIIPT